MASSWRFLSYVSGNGRCALKDWYERLSEESQATFDARRSYLAQTPNWQGSKSYAPLKGKKFMGLGEIKFKSDKTQHRVIGFQRPNREFVMLIGCIHKQKVYTPASALTTAAERRKAVKEEKAEARDYETECDEEQT